jgi:hydroxymethylglutaryl-CoA reductase
MSEWSGFHKLPPEERIERLARHAHLTPEDCESLTGGLSARTAEPLVENVIGTFALPLGLAVGFVIDGENIVVPMAVEESSVIAAASHGAKIVAGAGGFTTDVREPMMIGQVELRDVRDGKAALQIIAEQRLVWKERLNKLIPTMVARGGGVRAIEGRDVGGGRLVVHLHVDCRDAMGANLVNHLCENIGDDIAKACGGRRGLRILSNLATERTARASASIPVQALGGTSVARAIVEANEFALVDPYRAATHNKGIMNGVDPVVIATGNDWRAVAAGAHAYAARDGTYRGLTRYAIHGDELVCSLVLPLAVGTVGGMTALHPTARTCLKIMGNPGATRLAGIIACVGLAQNLAALRALSTEGIQRGHMALHARNVAAQAGLEDKEAERIARQMAAEGLVNVTRARELAAGLD